MTTAAPRAAAVVALALVAGVVALAASGPGARAPAPARPTKSAPAVAGPATADRAPRPRQPSLALRRAAAVFAADWLNMLAGRRLASQVRHAAPAVTEQFAGIAAPGGPGARTIAGRPRVEPLAGAGEGWAATVALRCGPPLQFVITAGQAGPTVYEVRLD